METKEQLKQLLSNLWVLFFDARNAHWNIQGIVFGPLHSFFQSLYEKAESNADDVAERLRQLGEFAPALMGDYLANKTIIEVPETLSEQSQAIKHLLNVNNQIVEQIRSIMQDLGTDEATRNLLAGMIQQMEKDAWMLRSYIN